MGKERCLKYNVHHVCRMDTYGKRIILTTSMGTFLAVVNSSSLLVSIPQIIFQLHISFFTALWVIVSYSLVLTFLTPIFGKYSDAIGRKKLYSAGYIAFLIGSIVSSVSFNGTDLIVGRIIQGVAGALLFSNSLAIITDSFRPENLRNALGINAAVIALGTAIGPLIGGVLTTFTWRTIFIFNMPFAVMGFLYSTKFIREMRARSKPQMDWTTAGFLSVFLISFIVYLTILPGSDPFNPYYLALAIFTLVMFVMFLVSERYSVKPILNKLIFRNKRFDITIYALVASSILRFSILFGLILLFQGPFGLTPLTAGIYVIPYAGAMGLASFFVGRIRKRGADVRYETYGLLLSFAGAIFLGVFILFFHSYEILIVPMIVVGLGNGLFYTPNTTVMMTSVAAERRGETSGIRTLMNNLGSVLGLTVVFLILTDEVSATVIDRIFFGISTALTGTALHNFYYAMFLIMIISGILCLTASIIVNSVKYNVS